MEYRFIGKTGCRASVISLGSYLSFGLKEDEGLAYECMRFAYGKGVNFFDTAELYEHGNAETMMGLAFQRLKWRRSRYLLATKLFWGGEGVNEIGLSRKHLVEGAEASLDRLKVPYVDFLYCHRPDIHTDIEETVRAMTHLVNSGKTLYWGTSAWSGKQIKMAFEVARTKNLIPPSIEQVPYSLLSQGQIKPLKSYIKAGQLGVIGHSPFLSGVLTGKYHLAEDGVSKKADVGRILGKEGDLGEMQFARDFFLAPVTSELATDVLKALSHIAQQLSCTLPQLALAWCLKNEVLSSMLIGVTSTKQLEENIHALDVAKKMTQQQYRFIGRLGGRFFIKVLLKSPSFALKNAAKVNVKDFRQGFIQ